MKMQRDLQPLIQLLVASRLSDREILAALSALRRVKEPTLLRLIEALRTATAQALKSDDFATTDVEGPIPSSSKMDYLSPDVIVREVETVLCKEAGLTISQALKELKNQISMDRPLPIGLRRTPKQLTRAFFRHWLSGLVELLSPSVVLHYATSIRNRHVHSVPSDWPLLPRNG